MVELFGKKFDISIAFVGLGGAGKTTLCNTLQNLTPDENITYTTRGMNIEVLTYESDGQITEFLAIDLGGQKDLSESVWKPHVESVQAVAFLFDGTDPESAENAKTWLFRVHDWMKSDASLLFLCNKSDLENCISLEEAIDALELTKLLDIRPHSLGIYRVSGLHNKDIDKALNWLLTKIKDDLKHARL